MAVEEGRYAYGPVMLDIEGMELTAEDRELFAHPAVNGLILFSRNYQDTEQLDGLMRQIRECRDGSLLVAVDHEGGRVQRFRDGFTRLPALRPVGDLYETDPAQAKALAEAHGWLIASELRAYDIDLAFSPVLDLDLGLSAVIGDRALHSDPQIVSDLALSLMAGLRRAGMAATGKHFPGHGGVEADSHLDLPIDERDLDELRAKDLIPFKALSDAGMESVMPAHVLYPKIDDKPAGFSQRWVEDILRQELGFDGAVFSDDLSMEGAAATGSYADRAWAALNAGCDVALVCNNRQGAVEIVDAVGADYAATLGTERAGKIHQRLAALRGSQGAKNYQQLSASEEWQAAVALVTA